MTNSGIKINFKKLHSILKKKKTRINICKYFLFQVTSHTFVVHQRFEHDESLVSIASVAACGDAVERIG